MDILASDSINLKSIKSVTEKVEEAKMEAKQAQDAAIDAAKTATDYMKFEEGVGLIVSKNAQSNEGASTVLTDNSLQIRKNGEKSAEFTDDRISFYGHGKKLVDIKSLRGCIN